MDFTETFNVPIDLKSDKAFDEIFSIEREMWKSTGRPGWEQIFKKHFAEGGVMVVPTDAGLWFVVNKEMYLKGAEESKAWESCNYKHISFAKHSKDVASVYYSIEARTVDNSIYNVMVSTTYQKGKKGIWKILSTQHRIPSLPSFDDSDVRRAYLG